MFMSGTEGAIGADMSALVPTMAKPAVRLALTARFPQMAFDMATSFVTYLSIENTPAVLTAQQFADKWP
jgi:hypothetical protein